MNSSMKVANLHFDEILQKVNDSANVKESLQEALKGAYVMPYLNDAISDKWADFDISTIKFNQYNYHRSMSGAFLLTRSTYNLYNSILMNPEVNFNKKVSGCKSLLEMLYKGEADVLIAIMNKNIHSIYPKISFKLLNEVL